MTDPIVRVSDLKVAYRQNDSWLRVLHGVDFTIGRGEVFGLVGESGCGKSTVGLQLLGYRHPRMRAEGGAVLFRDVDLLTLRRRDLDRLRGDRIGFVPQNPTTALNPGIRVGRQVAETLRPAQARKQREQGARTGRGALRPRRPAGAARTPGALSAPALRRPAAARLHRHGHGLRSRPRRPRRADDRPRRHHAGADHRAPRRSARAARHRHALRHARSRPARADRRPGRRHVCREHRRDGAGRRALWRPAASLHAGPDRLGPPHRGPGRKPSQAADRLAEAERAAARLPLRAALRF